MLKAISIENRQTHWFRFSTHLLFFKYMGPFFVKEQVKKLGNLSALSGEY